MWELSVRPPTEDSATSQENLLFSLDKSTLQTTNQRGYIRTTTSPDSTERIVQWPSRLYSRNNKNKKTV